MDQNQPNPSDTGDIGAKTGQQSTCVNDSGKVCAGSSIVEGAKTGKKGKGEPTEQTLKRLAEGKSLGGRAKKWETPEQMEEMVDQYFAETETPTICGLTLALGFVSRQSLLDYKGYGADFSDVIKRAKLRVEESYERDLRGKNAGGSIFALKNFGWTDQHEVTHKGLESFAGFLAGKAQGSNLTDGGA